MTTNRRLSRFGLLVMMLGGCAALVAGDMLLRSGQLFQDFQNTVSLKVLTYHYLNYADREISTASLLSQRSFVYFFAALCIIGVGVVMALEIKITRPYFVGFLVVLSAAMVFIFYHAEYYATYALG